MLSAKQEVTMPDVYETARIKWIKRQREMFAAQLHLLNGGAPLPFDGAFDSLIFAMTPEAKKALESWINVIDNQLGIDHA
jgi:hypothetical protein